MPSVSKKQQKFMGIVRAIQKGDAPSSKFSKKARDVAKSMKGKDVKKYASTKHKGLPNNVKSENKLFENPAAIAAGVRAAMQRAKEKELSVGGGKKVKVSTALSNKSHPQHKKAKGIIDKIKDKAKAMLSKAKKKKSEPKKQSKSDTNFYARQFGGKTESIYESVYKFRGMTKTDMDEFDAALSRENVKGTPDFNKMTYTIHRPKKDVYLDYYIKTKYKKFKPKRIKEGFGGELKGSDKKKFEKARKENAEQLGYKLTGKSDVNESVNERMDKRQAGEMLKQLGGNRFIAMTGAKNFVVGPKGAGFKIGRNAKNVNYVRIDLDKGKDLYDMYFNFVSVRGVKLKSKVKGVYADQLQKMFTKHTGMYTSL
jgi:hypothetical protein